MDKFKEKTTNDYRAWDLDCPYIGSRRWKIRLKNMFRKTARRRLRQELRKEINNET